MLRMPLRNMGGSVAGPDLPPCPHDLQEAPNLLRLQLLGSRV